MAKKNYIVLLTGSYGAKGDIVSLDIGKDGLSDRQKSMIKEYKAPVVKADDKKELTEANSKVKELTEKVTALELANKELTEANSALTKTK